MPKARRKLSDLVQEETRKPPDQAMQDDKSTDLQTKELPNLQTLEHRNSDTTNSIHLQPHDHAVSASPSAILVQEETSKPAEQEMQGDKPTDLQIKKLPNLQTLEHRNSDTTGSIHLQPHDHAVSASPSVMKKEIKQIPASSPMEDIKVPIENEVTELQSHKVSKYRQLERKETRLRQDQIDALTDLTRKLNRKRDKKGERLTDNTLIRVAVDLLLSQAGRLEGATETELRKSVGLEVTE